MLAHKATAHDFSGCPKKQATRDETLRIVRERSPFWQGGRLACDWLELLLTRGAEAAFSALPGLDRE